MDEATRQFYRVVENRLNFRREEPDPRGYPPPWVIERESTAHDGTVTKVELERLTDKQAEEVAISILASLAGHATTAPDYRAIGRNVDMMLDVDPDLTRDRCVGLIMKAHHGKPDPRKVGEIYDEKR